MVAYVVVVVVDEAEDGVVMAVLAVIFDSVDSLLVTNMVIIKFRLEMPFAVVQLPVGA